MKSRPQVIAAMILLVIVAAPVTHSLYHLKQPHFKGKDLAFWTATLADRSSASYDPVEAISRAGTNGIPYYIRWLQTTSSPGKAKALELLNNSLGKLNTSWIIRDESALRAQGATIAFSLLANDARQAEGELMKLQEH